MMELEKETVEAIRNYLGRRPYDEVAQLIAMMHKDIAKSVSMNKEEPDGEDNEGKG